MKIKDIILEGGWDTAVTQGTVINPTVVKAGLAAMDKFLTGFNKYLAQKGIPPVRMGTPTGSSAYHETDPEETVYGDIDLQIIVPDLPDLQNATQATMQGWWYRQEAEYAASGNTGIHPESSAGHPIVNVGKDQWVQVDMMIHPEPLAKWGAARVIPERGVKGMLHGNMFSVFGELLHMSIQHSGVQFKVRDNVRQPYTTTRKNYELKTISTDPETFVLDVFNHEAELQGIGNPQVDPLLKQYPGKNLEDVKIANLVNAIKGFARSCEANGMFGQGELSNYSSASDFIGKFWQVYEGKAIKDISGTKRDKAQGNPEAEARAEQDAHVCARPGQQQPQASTDGGEYPPVDQGGQERSPMDTALMPRLRGQPSAPFAKKING